MEHDCLNVFFFSSPSIFPGLSKLASVPAGGAVAAPAAGGGTTGAGAAPAAGTCLILFLTWIHESLFSVGVKILKPL